MSVIELAKEAGMTVFVPESLERFAVLVRAEALEEAAKVCDELKWRGPPLNFAENCAAAIRGLK